MYLATQKDKSIAIILPDLAVIGAQRVAIEFGKKLIESGYRVDWVCGGGGAWEGELDASQVRDFRPKVFKLIRGLRILESYFRLGIVLARQKHDFVICVTPLLNRVVCGFRLLKLFRGRLIIEEHAYPPRSYQDEFPNKIVRLFYFHTEWLYRYADILRVLTNHTKNYYKERYPDINSVAFPNLMDISRIFEDSECVVESKKLFDLVYLGRFTTQKNIKFLLDCFAELVKRIDCTMGIIGYGPQKDELIQKVKDLKLERHIQFIDTGPSNFSILRHAKVFPLVSLWEGFPLVLVEAMALETAVVAVDCKTGPRDLLGDGSERGWLVPEGDPIAFVYALEEALLNVDGRRKKVSAASAYVRKHLDIQKSFKEYIRIFIEADNA